VSAARAPGLRELQRWFASVTTHPDGVPERDADPERRRKLERLVTPGPSLSAAERLQIYNDGYFARLEECLVDDYPALSYALGADAFSQLAREYIAAHPSRSPSLNAYGAQMAAFCRTRPSSWAGFAADLARLEWALVEVVHEPVTDGSCAEALAALSAARWQTARLVPSRGLRVLGFDHPVNDFFQAFRDGQEPSLPGAAPSAVAVYRQGLALWRMNLEPRAAVLLQDLISGVPLASAVARLERRYPGQQAAEELAQRLPQWLGSWVSCGFFGAIA
jgi:hypothetical protein